MKIIEICNENLEIPEMSDDCAVVRRNLYKGKQQVTIAVVAYGKVERTRKCVESILKYTEDIPYQLILIDNGTPNDELLKYFESVEFDDKVILHIHKNISATWGINQVKRILDTEYFVLLNNDMIVTKNWLKNMIICAESDSRIGMICPVSTNVTPEQLETLGGFSDEEEMQEKAAVYNTSSSDKWEERIRLIPLIGFYRSEVLETVGYMDPGYLHDFGDDDHSFRIRRSGYKLVLCRDVFVHHDHGRENIWADPEKVEETNRGRRSFQNKFNEVDAWDDTQNLISGYIEGIQVEADEEAAMLAVEARCGTPILDYKNLCRRQRISELSVTAVTEQLKYYTDLVTVSSDVVGAALPEFLKRDNRQYNFIYCGKEINLYHEPLCVLEELTERLKPGGYLFVSLRNTYDYKSYLHTIGVHDFNDTEHPVQLHAIELAECLTRKNCELVSVYNEFYNVPGELIKGLKEALEGLRDNEAIGEVIEKLLVRNQIFIVKR